MLLHRLAGRFGIVGGDGVHHSGVSVDGFLTQSALGQIAEKVNAVGDDRNQLTQHPVIRAVRDPDMKLLIRCKMILAGLDQLFHLIL